MKNKPASLLVVSLRKTVNGMPSSSQGRQVAGPSSLTVVVAQSDIDMQIEHELTRINKINTYILPV